jgi:hypothetical protein
MNSLKLSPNIFGGPRPGRPKKVYQKKLLSQLNVARRRFKAALEGYPKLAGWLISWNIHL